MFRFLPTKSNREIWKLEKEFEKLILKVIEDRKLDRRQENEDRKDLLQIIIDGASEKHESKKMIMDMCSNMYFAGSETSALLVTWTLILLAKHPYWQERLRSEILETFPNISSPSCFHDMDKFRKLKQVSTILKHNSI